MQLHQDPDTEQIKTICESFIGAKIQISYNITLKNGDTGNGAIENCNIVGDCMENILYPFLKATIPTMEAGPKQKSPDYWNRKRNYYYEVKCFMGSPGFDVSNFNSYITQLIENLEKKLYKTQYLIFEYQIEHEVIVITDFKLCNVWDIINYTGKYPISLQCKKGMWYNIRPCVFKDMNNKDKTPLLFIKQVCEAVLKTPNKLEDDKEKIIDNIYAQFYKLQFNTVLLQI